MTWLEAPDYWLARLILERGIGALYVIGFLVVWRQFTPLLGERGLLPVSEFIAYVPFRASPSLFYLAPTDAAFRAAAWAGVILSAIAVAGLVDHQHALVSAVLWTALWALYLSFVNVGQTFYGFGWETLLLEAGFLAIFLGSGRPFSSTNADGGRVRTSTTRDAGHCRVVAIISAPDE